MPPELFDLNSLLPIIQLAGAAGFLGVIFYFFGLLVHSKDNRRSDKFTVTLNGLIFCVLLIGLPSLLVFSIIDYQLNVTFWFIPIYLVMSIAYYWRKHGIKKLDFNLRDFLSDFKSGFHDKNLLLGVIFLLNIISIFSFYNILISANITPFLTGFSIVCLLLIFIYEAIIYGNDPITDEINITLEDGSVLSGTLFKWEDDLLTLQLPDGKLTVPEKRILKIKVNAR